MKRLRKSILSLSQLESRLAPAITTLTWQGDIDDQWGSGTSGTNTNWSSTPTPNKLPLDGAILVFPAAPTGNKANQNNIANLDLKSLSFTGDGYTIDGQPITLSGGLTANYTTIEPNTFSAPITLVADQTFAFSGGGNATFVVGRINLGGKTLTVDNTMSVGATEEITGSGALTKNGAGSLVLAAINDFTGPVQVNAGRVAVSDVGGLGAVGAGNGTTVVSGATLEFTATAAGAIAEDIKVSGSGATGQTGATILRGADVTLTGALQLGADATVDAFPTDTFTFAGQVGAAADALAILTVKAKAATSPTSQTFGLSNTATFTIELAGLTPGAGGHDQLKVIGTVDLGGAALNVVPSFTPAVGDKFVIVDNDGAEATVGKFTDKATGATLNDGAIFTAGGVNFKINYNGLFANDVILTVDSLVEVPVPVTLSADAKTATFTDRDGDLVTMKTTKGPFQQSDFRVIEAGVGGQLQQINLTTHPGDFTGANLTITAKPGPLGGNGFVNVGYINAQGIDLGAVKIAGDLGRIAAGTVGGDLKVPGLKSLDVQSLGLLGTSTQSTTGASSSIAIEGALPKLAVKGDVRLASLQINGAADGKLGAVTIGGSVVANALTNLFAQAGIGSMTIGGDLRANGGTLSIGTSGPIGAITVRGSIAGLSSTSVDVRAAGQLVAPTTGTDVAIKSINVKGSVERARIEVGTAAIPSNADASIGAITVGGDWIASRVLAGTAVGGDGQHGTADDAKVFVAGTRDNPDLFSTIGSFTVKGQALGTADVTTDMFGVVAERIGKAKVGGRTFPFVADTNECFFAAPTLDGEGAESPSPMFDFTIRELGSTTPDGLVAGGIDFQLTNGGKTASFNDLDGDRVTVTRSTGVFVQSNFEIPATVSGGAEFIALNFSAAAGDPPPNLTIAAKPGPSGGNGFVNVGQINASGIALGNVSIAGDIGQFTGGLSVEGKAGTGAFSAHSAGVVFANAGANTFTLNFVGGIGKVTIATDVRGTDLSSNDKIGAITIGGSVVATVTDNPGLSGGKGMGAVKIGGSVLKSGIFSNNGAIGSITIGGDLIGNGANATISAFGQLTAPAKGLDLAIKSLIVKGNIENARIEVGTGFIETNADASIGTISVGRAWLASSVLVGADEGGDTFLGTADDTKELGTVSTRDVINRFSTISSVTIKGQALGSTAGNDSFGIVAEQILKAKIGARTIKFAKGERSPTDAFAIAPTGPGAGPDNADSDLFIREITV